MAVLNLALIVALLSVASAQQAAPPQLYSGPNVGSSSTGSSAPDTGRSGFISAVDQGSSSTGSSSLSSSAQSGVRSSSSQDADTGVLIDGNLDSASLGDVTITQEMTVDVFSTVTNVIYNSIPITLTEFMKTTAVQPTLLIVSTAVDDHVFVATAPVTRTDSVTVTNTNTGYFYVTQISTDLYTITHKAYDILQKTLTSTLQQTQVFRPTVVRTRINTEYDTQTVEYLVTNTIVIQPRSSLPFDQGTGAFPQTLVVGQQQVFGNQQVSGLGQQLVFANQLGSSQGQQQVFGQRLFPENSLFTGQGGSSNNPGQARQGDFTSFGQNLLPLVSVQPPSITDFFSGPQFPGSADGGPGAVRQPGVNSDGNQRRQNSEPLVSQRQGSVTPYSYS